MIQYLNDVFNELRAFKPLTAIILVVFVVGPLFLSMLQKKKKDQGINTRAIVYGGICIAVSFVLSYIRLYHWPQGGSVTPASMLPMFIYAIAFGPVAGITAGVAYGFLQLIQDPYLLHWAQILLDYPIAFGAMGLAGLSRRHLPLGILIGGSGRFVAHFISGVVFFGIYAPEGMNVWIFSLAVNGLIMGTETIICIAVGLVPAIRNVTKRIKRMSTV